MHAQYPGHKGIRSGSREAVAWALESDIPGGAILLLSLSNCASWGKGQTLRDSVSTLVNGADNSAHLITLP